ncbi:hypothetical protein QLR68_23415 [Micromonospora sp. DH15]|nr:hypothetical protein [Micromonospora sp. DH15]
MTAAARVFLPLTDSPLLNNDHDADAELAIRLAATADPDPATIRALLSITAAPTAGRITRTLDDRTDLPLAALALLVAHRPDSHGYYPSTGPTPTALLYQRAVRDLLQLDVGDPQAGFKAFPAAALRTALPLVTDHSLAFDTDLLTAIARSGHTLAEVGVAALHHYVEDHRGTPRDYDAMLAAVHRQALRHGLDSGTRRTPTWDRIRHAAAAAEPAVKPTSPTSR